MCLYPQWISPYWKEEGYSFYFSGEHRDRSLLDEATGELIEPFQVGCGKCIECLDLHRLQWVHRLLDEAKCHKHKCFITLTYRNSDSFDGNLHPEHWEKFLKDLREYLRYHEKIKIRFFMCGEYGSQFKRPHYHAVIFGYSFSDKVFFKMDKKQLPIYRSLLLESLWTFGFSSVMEVCDATLNYVTKDMQKLLPVPSHLLQPFTRQSTKPGIGVLGWSQSLSDGRLWHNGKSVSLPRYYKRWCEKQGIDLYDLKKMQVQMAQLRDDSDLPQRKLKEINRYKKLGIL